MPGLRTQVSSAQTDTGAELAVTAADDGLSIALPASRPDSLIPVITLKLAAAVEARREAFVLNRCRNTLESGVAALTGCKQTGVQWMEKFGDWKHAECVAGWEGAGSAATWTFRTVESGAFYLDIEYTCPAEDDYSEWRVHCGDTDLTFPLIDSGERPARAAFGGALPRFRTDRVGVIDFANGGVQQLRFGPTGAEGKGVRIASLRLVPVE
ncbi:MAG: hypothetical protein COZ06_36755 [Armatimonadetes bacterium CG_4_10_14_3_um_filter_66_18]|nr:hypothetical protein [Armatimonadota bacterium]OIP05580.1 MAG: hypothetical protein AUJ96_10530 [Armatimonadetes bacterium CG2_30_66_41]PIU87751.1 MAG: hypothetical protein COS65_33175 [Armatimonadetes bacterium CG06_land_8_20_14_3_00_66_21]PIW19286.1 MAG: hypothetical protein COW34_03870 [Armatimonadetes bacterium CG17_big_fil_post_rev_8_21_14_2_50_66_6]PIX40790.1 MAG: hypothetical protein COZ57_25015 [Armatimonadetes bacterium CG_4_8_14_3_um_filter_66_20]PIY36169.1 MAG: hypothetical prote